MLNLRFVQTLREVAEHGSFSAAAEALHFTQPAVSRQVALLAAMAGGTSVSVALGGFPTAFVGLVPAIVRALRERVPDAAIELRRCGHDEGLARVRRGELDLALVFAGADGAASAAGPGDVAVVHLAD